jgi:diaminohydroxyphosphoribosylaminopyrimidine deaminase/5-amino-6-(5-phosphoribosylamino)uracil reductase
MNPPTAASTLEDLRWMDRALRLAMRGYGRTSPNPMVGAVLVKDGKLLGAGWHRQAGAPHAEIEALRDAARRGHSPAGSTLYVTLEPCSTYGRTPPCTDAIVRAAIRRVIVAGQDPNPQHAGVGFELLRQAGIEVLVGPRQDEANRLNEAFNHWITHRTPWVTVKAAMTLDGRIAARTGDSRWITGTAARAYAMRLRRSADAILVGINTLLADDPRLTVRKGGVETPKNLRRLVLDSQARTPLTAHVLSDSRRDLTTIVVAEAAPKQRVTLLHSRVRVLAAPTQAGRIDLRWLLDKLGEESVTHLLVEGGGEVNASFLLGGFAHRVAFFYAPKLVGGRSAPSGVAGEGIDRLQSALQIIDLCWRRLGQDFLLTGRVRSPQLLPGSY